MLGSCIDASRRIPSLKNNRYLHFTASIGYIIFPKFWGLGYGKEACQRLIELLFCDYKVTAISAETDTRNIRSIKLLEELGFQRIKTNHQVEFIRGDYNNEYVYVLKKKS